MLKRIFAPKKGEVTYGWRKTVEGSFIILT
jgi:hypothetical protein